MEQDTSPNYSDKVTHSCRLCLTCGRLMEKHRRRYCSQHCKDEFILKLKWFNNILRALHTKYATFSYTESYLILNILPTSKDHVFTYFYHRSPGRKPAQDMNHMVFGLGEIWWSQKSKSNSTRYASEYILNQGHRFLFPYEQMFPLKIHSISQINHQLTLLKLDPNQVLHSTYPQDTVKSAYKQAALKSHPDLGGNAESFRKVHQAYLDLLEWLKKPTYSCRQGLPGQWCFVAWQSRWLSPL